MGSSAAAVVAGVQIFSQLGSLDWTKERMLTECLRFEHHPDNISAALYGHITVSKVYGMSTFCLPIRFVWEHEIDVIALIPYMRISTDEARRVLPTHYSRDDVVHNLQSVALLMVGLHSTDRLTAKTSMRLSMTSDRIHQCYRAKLIPGLEEILNDTLDESVWGLWLSGSGPTIMVITDKNSPDPIDRMRRVFERYSLTLKILSISIDQHGSSVYHMT